jgi:hypothetical protein
VAFQLCAFLLISRFFQQSMMFSRALCLLALVMALSVAESQPQPIQLDAKSGAEACDRERSRLARELLNQVGATFLLNNLPTYRWLLTGALRCAVENIYMEQLK